MDFLIADGENMFMSKGSAELEEREDDEEEREDEEEDNEEEPEDGEVDLPVTEVSSMTLVPTHLVLC
jgi:hypothetical protein